MRTPQHSGRLRRRAVLSILMLAVAVAFALSGSASGEPGDASARFQATSLTPDSTFTGAKSQSGYLARTDPSLLGRRDATRINVFVKYDYDASASYTGGVAGLRATSPSVTGKGLKNRTAAVRAYDRYTAALSREITADIEAAVPSVTVRATYRTVYGGIAASVPANAIARPPEGRRGRRRAERLAPATADRRDAEVHRRDAGVAVDRRHREGRQGRHGRRARHRHLAGASVLPGHGPSGRRRCRTSASSATAATSLISGRRSRATTSSSAPTRSRTPTSRCSARCRASTATTHQDAARRVTRTGTARTRPRLRPATRSRARRSSASSAGRSAASLRAPA